MFCFFPVIITAEHFFCVLALNQDFWRAPLVKSFEIIHNSLPTFRQGWTACFFFVFFFKFVCFFTYGIAEQCRTRRSWRQRPRARRCLTRFWKRRNHVKRCAIASVYTLANISWAIANGWCFLPTFVCSWCYYPERRLVYVCKTAIFMFVSFPVNGVRCCILKHVAPQEDEDRVTRISSRLG